MLDNTKLLTAEDLENHIFFTEELIKQFKFSHENFGFNPFHTPLIKLLRQDIKDYQTALEADPFDYGL